MEGISERLKFNILLKEGQVWIGNRGLQSIRVWKNFRTRDRTALLGILSLVNIWLCEWWKVFPHIQSEVTVSCICHPSMTQCCEVLGSLFLRALCRSWRSAVSSPLSIIFFRPYKTLQASLHRAHAPVPDHHRNPGWLGAIYIRDLC